MSHDPQERDAIALRRAVRIGVIAIAIGVAAVWWSIRLDRGAPQIARETELGAAPSVIEPSLIATNASARDLAAAQRRTLTSWAWVDREHGIARIPIDEAVEVVLRQEAK
jgi:hypothetical protein